MKTSHFYKVIGIAILIRILLLPLSWHPDVNNHVDWGIRFFEYGAAAFYAPESNVWSFTWPNQPPFTMLLFALTKLLYDILFSFLLIINNAIPLFPSGIVIWSEDYLMHALVKLPAVIADFGIAWIIYKFLLEFSNKKKAHIGAAIFLLNPVIWYNSALWGQTDATINFFGLLSVYFLYNKRYIFSSLLFTLSLLTKVSLLIYLPLIAIIFVKSKTPLRNIVLAIIAGGVLSILIALPFADKNPIFWLFDLYQQKVLTEQLQLITANAFNLWALLTGIDEISHFLFFGPLQYVQWGYLFFALFYVPLLWFLYKKPQIKVLLWTLLLSSFSAFLLLTNMHERYLYPMFPVFSIIVMMYPKLFTRYVGISSVNLLNLYHLWWVPRIPHVPQLLAIGSHAIPRFLSLLSIGIFLMLYRDFLRLYRQGKL